MNINDLSIDYIKYLEQKGSSLSTIKNTLTVLDMLSKKCDILEDITFDIISKFAEEMKSKGNKKQTINQKINRLSVVFDYAVERGYISSNPCNHFVRMKSDDINLRRDLKPEEIQALLVVAEGEYRCRWAIHVYTGLRATNVAEICWSWIDFNNNTIKVPAEQYKTRKDVTIPLHPKLKHILREYRKENDSDPVFPKKSLNAIRNMLRNHCKKAGINTNGVDLHALRHTFASSLLNAGTRIEVISMLLGHKNIETTQKYLHYDKTTLEEGILNLPY